MATAEALKKVDDLKETWAGSLKKEEKDLLNSLTKAEIESKKAVIESKTFVIDGKKVSLPQIVKDVKISPDREKSTLYGKPIARQSELWAAIQLYVIIHNKSVGKPLIDWKVGRLTNEGIADTQTDVKAGKKAVENEVQVKNMSVAELKYKSFREYITPKSNIKYFEDKGILDSYTGVLNFQNKDTYAKDNCLKFKHKYAWKTVEYSVPLKQDANHKINPNELARSLAANATAAERNVRSNKAEAWIDSFRESNITDPVIKRWTEIAGINFACDTGKGGSITIRAVSKWKNLATITRQNNSVLKSDWSFDSAKFNNVLKEAWLNVAEKAVKDEIQKSIDWLPAAHTLHRVNVDSYVTSCNNLKQKVASYGHSNDFKGEMAKIENVKTKYVNQKNYLDARKKVDDVMNNILKLWDNNDKFIKNFDSILTEFKKIAKVEKDPNVKYKYTVKYNNTLRQKFEKAGADKKQEYNKLIDNAVNARRNIKQWWDSLYTIAVSGR